MRRPWRHITEQLVRGYLKSIFNETRHIYCSVVDKRFDFMINYKIEISLLHIKVIVKL